jgi:uncharacterized protein (DUF488 family)
MKCESPHAVHTIGHSTRPFDAFVSLLKVHAIQLIVDVRRWPASRRFPHFNREELAASLKADGFDYLWRGDLGGFRKPVPDSPNSGWRVGTFRAYADFMMTAEFGEIMNEIVQVARESSIALMCAEAMPWRCHRQLLADAFLVRGWNVRHIMDDRCREHHLPPFAKPDGTRIVYQSLL